MALNAGEVVQELILASSARITASKLMYKIYPYPTAANIHKITIRKCFVKELKPWMIKVARRLYKLEY